MSNRRDSDEVREIRITDMGQETVHFLKEPSGPDWWHYLGAIAHLDPCIVSSEQLAECYKKVYDGQVIRVENYLFGSEPLMTHAPEGWKALIPEHHKILVALELVAGYWRRSRLALDLSDLATSGGMLLSARRDARAKIAGKARAASERN